MFFRALLQLELVPSEEPVRRAGSLLQQRGLGPVRVRKCAVRGRQTGGGRSPLAWHTCRSEHWVQISEI